MQLQHAERTTGVCQPFTKLMHILPPLQLRTAFEPYASLWRTAAELGRRMPDWLDGPFDEIDAEAVANDVDT